VQIMIMHNKKVYNSNIKKYHCMFLLLDKVCTSTLSFINLQREGKREITASYKES
jgi:hypothetical protein